jgi:hypothetical protein
MAHDREHSEPTSPTQGLVAGAGATPEHNGEPMRAESLMAAASAGDVRRMEPPERGLEASRTPAWTDPAADPKPRPRPSALSVALLAVLMALPSGALGAWAYLTYLNPPPVSQAAPVVPAERDPEPAPQAPSVATDDLKQVTKHLELLADRIDRLQEKFAAIPRPAPTPDLTALQAQVENLVKDDASFCMLPSRISALGDRIAEIERSLAELQAAVKAADAQSKKTGGSALASLTVPAARTMPASLAADSALAEGASLLQRRQYAEALALFSKLEQSSPDDARVWYFAAVANGLKTGQWRDETERLVAKGLERERAGTPDHAQINASLADHVPASARDWLAGHRKNLSAR